MKKYWIIAIVILVLSNSLSGQSHLNPFFERNGTVSLQTAALDSLADTLAVVNHRDDDIVWSKTVYRVIDMRDKQNYQLYFPVTPNNENRSLFRLILEAALNDSLKAFNCVEKEIKPAYDKVMSRDDFRKLFIYITLDPNDTTYKIQDKEPLVVQNPLTQQDSIVKSLYAAYVKNQMKFIIQEIVYFDKHTSRLYSNIIGIAPFYGLNETNISFLGLAKRDANYKINAWDYLRSSVLCWFRFNDLRPYLARQYVIPNSNSTQRLTFDEFFSQKLYSSYLLGDSNNRGWMLLQYLTDAEKIRKEQQRIETEMLNFEQDLWEY